MCLRTFSGLRRRVQDAVLRRYENALNYLHTVSWLNVGICLNLFFGVVFLVSGLFLLTGQEQNIAVGWVFFSVSLCMILLGLFLLIIRCMFPTKSAHTRPHQHRPRRPNRIYNVHPRFYPSSAQRAHSMLSPTQVWTTLANDLEGQPMSQFIARLHFNNAQRTPISLQAPPTYDQAVGRPSGVQPGVGNLPPPYS